MDLTCQVIRMFMILNKIWLKFKNSKYVPCGFMFCFASEENLKGLIMIREWYHVLMLCLTAQLEMTNYLPTSSAFSVYFVSSKKYQNH